MWKRFRERRAARQAESTRLIVDRAIELLRGNPAAHPGDPDLDFDVDGLTITEIVVVDRHFIVKWTGGFGCWVTRDGRADFTPGDSDSYITDGEMTFGFGSGMAEVMLEYYIHWFEEQKEKNTPLRITAAKGRWCTIREDNENWLPLPYGDA